MIFREKEDGTDVTLPRHKVRDLEPIDVDLPNLLFNLRAGRRCEHRTCGVGTIRSRTRTADGVGISSQEDSCS